MDEEEGDDAPPPPYLVWRRGQLTDGICKTDEPDGVPSWRDLDEGKPLRATWPDSVTSTMSARFPRDTGLADALYNTYIVVSARVKSFLEEAGVPDVELLPLAICDHAGAIASRDYFIVHPTSIVECLDDEASEAERSKDGTVRGVAQLVLRDEALPSSHPVFRLARWPSRIIIRRDLAEAMEAAGLTGLGFLEPESYDGLI